MTDEAPHFDALMGGTEALPSFLSLTKFVACRSQEIQIMKNSLIAQSGTKLAFQTIPKHMRRRAMSHNVKRLPRRLRQIHLNQMKKSGMPIKQKRPSRKFRRRPTNLIEEYTKRSKKKFRWLYTHIWHAKRFHMTEKWGYKLPHYPCDKAFRACYRAMSKHCLLQDISYYICIEVEGDQQLIVEKLKLISAPHNGLSIGARAFIQGNREGEIVLYEIEETKFKNPIGNATFHWQPGQNRNVSKLWIWVHAAFYDTVYRVLRKCFEGYSNIKLSELSSELCRFRLTGPLSNSILHDAVKTLDIENTDELPASLKKFILKPENKQIILDQCKYWDDIQHIESTSGISPHSIVSLIVKDPRLNFPKKRKKSVPEVNERFNVTLLSNISLNPLWDDELRKKINESKIPDSQVAVMQSKLLVPGTVFGQVETLTSIILVQRPGSKKENIGWGGGWDVILPSAWAKTFWIAFIMRGARVGGLRESDSMLFEMGNQQLLQPDTKAGTDEERRVFNAKIEKFFKRPPNKRINYNKFKIVSPFCCNWRMLLKDWNGSTADFSVVRDKKILSEIDLFLKSKTHILPQYPKNSLIPVKIDCATRGSPLQFAIICLPKSQNDFKTIVTEPVCIDDLQQRRKELREAHQTLKKKFKKQRKTKSDSFKSEIYKEQLENFTKKMRSLWLPEPMNIRNSCSKEVIGFVTKGGFSFSFGKGCGTGYIASDCLQEMLKFKDKVLFRNTNSRQYKEAKLSVIVE